ncbi:MAG TPA: NADH-quinone oxidoreductase subunit J, partial [Saprospiraceae bacterium]|nr:NADH-quinone oxidoreductase subunit J [Saprospiraceae bacterium]
GHFLLLNAQFLAVVHIIVYGGAIMVLFLFVVMMLNLNKESDNQKSSYIKLAAIVASGILLLTIVASIKSFEIGDQMVNPLKGQGSVQSIGKELFSTFLLPFEISSILLFAAIVGTVMLAKKELD